MEFLEVTTLPTLHRTMISMLESGYNDQNKLKGVKRKRTELQNTLTFL